jgi:hypothetical protein
MIRKRIEWVEGARTDLLMAIGEDVMSPTIHVASTVDPLKFILKIDLKRPLQDGTREHLRRFLRCIAEDNGCELPIIRITERWIQAELLIQQRVWERNALGRFKGARRFESRSR